MPRIFTLTLLMSCWLASWSAAAQSEQDKATARDLFFDAATAMREQKYEQAADLFARSNALFPAPTAQLGVARALDKLGRLAESYAQYVAVARAKLSDDAPPAFVEAVEQARTESSALKPRVPALIVSVEGSEPAEVRVDERTLPDAALGVRWPVNPGKHDITATSPDHDPFHTSVTIAEGETQRVVVRWSIRAAPAPPRPQPARHAVPPSGNAQRIAGYVVGAVGVASLVAAAVTAGLFFREKGIVDDECDEAHRCSQAGLDAADTGRTLGLINTITLFGGVALVGAGLAIVLTAPSDGASVGLIAHGRF